ncbi:MAG: DUF4402 domain-containing protein [Alphaproteobacteria bacterium]|nr:DUF4402 domain-containing protein [Alphaproteobacteria bacterium]MCL2504702.1 DUF4402 domain-containing protein [Alphaproteobacteria bacterium]
MRHSLLFIFTFLAVLFFPSGSANAQQQYLTAEAIQHLNFGSFIYTGTSAAVTISTAGQYNSPIQPFITGTHGIVLTTTNVNNGQLQYTLGGTTATLQGPNGGTINVTNIVALKSKEPLSGSGELKLENPVGGTATITPGLTIGEYSGFVALTAGRGNLTSLVNIPVRLTLLPRLEMEEISSLNFGRMQLVAGMGGRIRIDPATGLRSLVNGSVNLVSNTHSQGQFRISGIPNHAITMSLPNTVTVSNAGGSASMTTENFTRYPSSPNLALAANGYLDMNIGGDLVVSANQPYGTYSGSYVITINY